MNGEESRREKKRKEEEKEHNTRIERSKEKRERE